MKKVTILLAAAGIAAVSAAAAMAQPATPPAPAPAATVTPAQIEAAEKALRVRARAALRPLARTPADRLAAARTARSAVAAAELGPTVSLTPRAPYAAGKAWLNVSLGVVDLEANAVAVMAYADEFAPAASIEVMIPNTPARRYVVECGASVLGGSGVRATVLASDTAFGPTWGSGTPIRQDPVVAGPVVTVVTPATTAPFVRVVLDVPASAIDATGQAVLVVDKCEATPFP